MRGLLRKLFLVAASASVSGTLFAALCSGFALCLGCGLLLGLALLILLGLILCGLACLLVLPALILLALSVLLLLLAALLLLRSCCLGLRLCVCLQIRLFLLGLSVRATVMRAMSVSALTCTRFGCFIVLLVVFHVYYLLCVYRIKEFLP